MREDGTVKVLDFGLAKALDTTPQGDPSQSPTLTAAATQMGVIMGTAAYMSPEQAAGQTADKRSDLWSFGVVLFEMLTGQRLFTGKTVAHVMAKVLDRDLDITVLPTATPAPIKRLLRRCLEREPKRRLRDVGEALIHFEEAATVHTDEPSAATSVAPVAQPALWRQALPLALGTLVLGSIITGFAVWSVTRPESPAARSPARFEVITPPTGGLDAGGIFPEVALSPDRSRIVYGARTPASRGLYVRPINQLDAIPVRGAEGGRSPFFSFDGNQIGFIDRGAIKRIPLLGGPAITICDPGDTPWGVSWGPDDRIVFGTGTRSGLWRVAASGGEPAPLTTADPEGQVNHAWPHILPGGRAVLFTILTGGPQLVSVAIGSTQPLVAEQADVAVLNLDTGEQTVLFSGGSNPQYSPTGHIVYGFDGTLWAVGFDPDRLSLTTLNPVPVLEDVNTKASGATNFSLSADGSIVYVPGTVMDRRDAERRFVWVDREGREEPTAAEARAYQEFTLSPDGTQVAAIVAGDVWLHDLERGTGTRLTFNVRGQFPLWTPNGERITFGSVDGFGAPLSWKAADGTGEVEPLADDEYGGPNTFSPDGTVMVFDQDFDRLGVLSLEGERVSTVWDFEHRERNADLSPDGRWLAYMSDETGQYEVFVRPFPEVDTGQLSPLPSETRWQVSRGGGEWPLWSPDGGDELFYVGPQGMMAVAVETDRTFTHDTPELLFDTATGYGVASTVGGNRRMDISPDGNCFLMFKEATTEDATGVPEINVVLNWAEELKRLVPID